MIAGFGGGFFFGSFTTTQGFGQYVIVPSGAVGVYGAWSHILPIKLTSGGRWLMLQIYPQDYGSVYELQIGLGPAGAEVPFQPTDGTGFYLDWFDTIKWTVPNVISFPVNVGVGQELSLRCWSDPPSGPALSVYIYLWN